VYVLVKDTETEKETECVSERVSAKERNCVCVCERERERVRERLERVYKSVGFEAKLSFFCRTLDHYKAPRQPENLHQQNVSSSIFEYFVF